MQESSYQYRKSFIELLKINVSILEGFTFANDHQRLAIADNAIQKLRDFAVRSSVSKSDAIRFEQTYAVLQRLSLNCPDARVRSKLTHELSLIQGHPFAPFDKRISRFLSDLFLEESLTENAEIFHAIFNTFRGRIPFYFFAFAFDSDILEAFFSTIRELFFGSESPLPVINRIFIALTAASRVNCEPLVRELMEQFLLHGGDENWLLEPDVHVPVKLQTFQKINVKLAHCPWELCSEDISHLKVNCKWASGELSHALLIASTFHALGSLALSLGLRTAHDLGADWVVEDLEEREAPAWLASFGQADIVVLLSQYASNADWNDVSIDDWERLFLQSNAAGGRNNNNNNNNNNTSNNNSSSGASAVGQTGGGAGGNSGLNLNELRAYLKLRMDSSPRTIPREQLMLIAFRLPQERESMLYDGLDGSADRTECNEKSCMCIEYLLAKNAENVNNNTNISSSNILISPPISSPNYNNTALNAETTAAGYSQIDSTTDLNNNNNSNHPINAIPSSSSTQNINAFSSSSQLTTTNTTLHMSGIHQQPQDLSSSIRTPVSSSSDFQQSNNKTSLQQHINTRNSTNNNNNNSLHKNSAEVESMSNKKVPPTTVSSSSSLQQQAPITSLLPSSHSTISNNNPSNNNNAVGLLNPSVDRLSSHRTSINQIDNNNSNSNSNNNHNIPNPNNTTGSGVVGNPQAASSATPLPRCCLCNRPMGVVAYVQDGVDNSLSALQVESYTWQETIAAALCGVAPVIADAVQHEVALAEDISDGRLNGVDVPTTRPLRQGINAYVQKLLGVHQIDFNYFVMNTFVGLCQKILLKKFACFPQRITHRDVFRVLDTLNESDLTHYIVLVFEGRRQAELLFGLKALISAQFL